MDNRRNTLHGFLWTIQQHEKRCGQHNDTVTGLLIDHGREFMAHTLDPDFPRMAPKQCFRNAMTLALEYPQDLVYCEGYVSALIPILHGWCADEDGQVVDPTLDRPDDREYFGIPFKLSYAAEYHNTRGLPILADWEGRYPVLRTPVHRWLAGEFLTGKVKV
mgnify:CR=1 FL=1